LRQNAEGAGLIINEEPGEIYTNGLIVDTGSSVDNKGFLCVDCVTSGTILPNAAKDYSESAAGDVAKNWTSVANDVLQGTPYTPAPAGVDAGKSLMVSEFVYSAANQVSSPAPSSTTQTSAVSLASLSDGITWKQAVEKCAGLTEGGYSDWYLPNIAELVSLETGKMLGYSAISSRPYVNYWSSTEASATSAWNHRFSSGSSTTYGLSKTYATDPGSTWVARCVRRNN
jgi:hypothetical protein